VFVVKFVFSVIIRQNNFIYQGVKRLKSAVYFYDAKGNDEKIELENVNLETINDKQLVWINILHRDRKTIEKVVSDLGLKDVPVKTILDVAERPTIDVFESFYRFFIVSVEDGFDAKMPIDFIVGRNFVITIHDGEVSYFEEFREHKKGETQIGELDAENFIAALLDLHIVSYFRALEDIERKVDRLDELILRTNLEDRHFLSQIVQLRKRVSKLRRLFLPHRDVFYALSRADFRRIAESDSAEQFRMLDQHFENAVDAIESSRDTVLSLFDLFTTKATQSLNHTMRRLTFVTLIVGALGAVAGIWGMNFEVGYFKSAEFGFWATMTGMGFYVLGAILLGKFLRWF
jgi:magnesium/cobalt transport protein CorA